MIQNKNILITGGAGFIGSNLVKQLYDSNNITVLDDFSSGFKKNLYPFPNINLVHGDIRNKNVVDYSMKDIDVVFHMAASVGVKRGTDNPISDSDINVLGTIQVLESAVKHGVKKIVTSSSAAIYGEPKIFPIIEDYPTNPESQYGCSKLCEEKLTLCYGKMYNIDTICLRYFNVFGPNQYSDAYGSVIPIFVSNAINNKPLIINGHGQQTRDFVHVKDIVQANIKAAESVGISGSFNVSTGKIVTLNELAEIISNHFSNNISILHGKKRPGDAMHSWGDISLIKEKLNYSPQTDLVNDINDYIEWYKNI